MAKCKKCPSCGSLNSPTSFECDECGYDLTSVPVSDPQQEEEAVKTPAPAEEKKQAVPAFVKICECGESNPPNARVCSKCGADISFVIPQEAQKAEAIVFSLEVLGSDYVYDLVEPVTVIGRECEMKDILASRFYVSRKHAEISVEDGKCYVRDLGSMNHTFVNGTRTEGRVEIHCGDIISLGGTVTDGDERNICILRMAEKG